MGPRTLGRNLATLTSLVALTLVPMTAFAATPARELVGPDPLAVNEVGTSVAAYAGFTIAGSPFENDFTLPNEGPESFEARVRLFREGNHVRDYYIEPFCDLHSGAGERNTLALGARGLVVGLPRFGCEGTTQAGAVIVYPKTSSDYSSSYAFLTPPLEELERDSRYGSAVATHGDWLAVGAPGAPFGVEGRVDLWHHTGGAWTHAGWLPKPVGLPAESRFGAALAMHEDLMIVGAPAARMFYVYHREQGAWSLRAQYRGTAPTGRAVDITSSFLVSSDSGTVTIYRRTWNDWVPHQVIVHPEFPGAPYGEAVGIDQHRLVLGNPSFRQVALYGLQGNYVHLGNMVLDLAGSPSGVSELLRFGVAVAIDNDDIIASDNNARHSGSSSNFGAIFYQKYYQVY